MGEIKQVILVRSSYPDGKGGTKKIRAGKMASQAAHASMKVLLDMANLTKQICGVSVCERAVGHDLPHGEFEDPPERYSYVMTVNLPYPIARWVQGSFKKIVLGVAGEEELLQAYAAALEAGIPAAIITDNGETEFHGVPTRTACAIGPHYSNKIDEITGPNGIVQTKLL